MSRPAHRRAASCLAAYGMGLLAGLAGQAGETGLPAVRPGVPVQWPADHGSHPDFRTEWWYVTGWLETPDGEPLGFQVTFFRTRPDMPQDNPSAFAPRQLVIAHAALSDPRRPPLQHDQRVARASHGLAGAQVGDTRVWIGDWRLERRDGAYRAQVVAEGFSLDLELRVTQPPMLNGEAGYSRKGPDPASASYYYSIPQLAVTGRVVRDDVTMPVTGTAWLDHEWSTALMDEAAAGWDWVGLNLDDGSALMAFRMRDAAGASLWSAATLRGPDGSLVHFGPGDVAFEPLRRWVSPRTGTAYPVEFRVQAGETALELFPLLDDQEVDARLSTGAVYWEGAVVARRDGAVAGRGYLELTGYGARLRLPGG